MAVKLSLSFFVLAPIFLSPSPLLALPRYAVFEGAPCASCHVNKTGAGMRTEAGGQLFTEDLVMAFTEHLRPKDLRGRLTPFASIGADLRMQNLTTMSPQTTNSSTVPQGSLYLELNAGKYVEGYADFDLANTVSREIFLMVHKLPLDLYIKVGRLNLPYGLRIDDGTSPIRNNFNVNFNSQDIGGEVGLEPEPFEIALAVTNGVPGGTGDENEYKAITTSAAWVGERGRLGSSFQWNNRPGRRLTSFGGHGGLCVGRVAWLAEVDFQEIHSTTGGGDTWMIAGYSSVDFNIIQGLFVRTVYDYLDPNYRGADNLQHRVGFGFDLYPLPYSQVSLLYRVNVGAGAAGDDQLLAHFHFFF